MNRAPPLDDPVLEELPSGTGDSRRFRVGLAGELDLFAAPRKRAGAPFQISARAEGLPREWSIDVPRAGGLTRRLNCDVRAVA